MVFGVLVCCYVVAKVFGVLVRCYGVWSVSVLICGC